MSDAPTVQTLAGTFAVSDTTRLIPYPYPDGAAEQWIAAQPAAFEQKENVVFAITLPTNELVGAIHLRLSGNDQCGELGYWIGEHFWGRGYATEAVRAVIDFGFDTIGLHRIEAHHLSRNPSSGRVMQKAGMQHEGTMRERVLKNGRFESLEVYGVLAHERQQGK